MAAAQKPSLFSNKPSWLSSKPFNTQDSDDVPIFGRDEKTYLDIVEEDRRRRERREAKVRVRAQTGRSKFEGQPTKRRRISKESVDESDNSDARSSKSANSDGSTKSQNSTSIPVTRSTPKKKDELVNVLDSTSTKQRTPTRSATTKAPVIELDDDSDEPTTEKPQVEASTPGSTESKLIARPSSLKTQKQSRIAESESEEEDEYLRELKQKAREKARLKYTVADSGKPSIATSASVSPARSPSLEQTRPGSSHPAVTSPRKTPNPVASSTNADDPLVELLITTTIPHAKPLRVHRHVSQPLQQVKEFWCDRQGFDKAFSIRVFFTWRGTKLFNATTMRAILQRLKTEKGEDLSKGQIHIEAMTPEIYENRQKQLERKRAQEAGMLNDSNDDEQDDGNGNNGAGATADQNDANEAEASKMKEGVVIRLTAQGLEPMPLRVRPNTSIDKIMRGFHKTRGIEPEKRCWLVFDGERLEPELLVKDVGFEDGDDVEVYPR